MRKIKIKVPKEVKKEEEKKDGTDKEKEKEEYDNYLADKLKTEVDPRNVRTEKMVIHGLGR